MGEEEMKQIEQKCVCRDYELEENVKSIGKCANVYGGDKSRNIYKVMERWLVSPRGESGPERAKAGPSRCFLGSSSRTWFGAWCVREGV